MPFVSTVPIPTGEAILSGAYTVPDGSRGLVVLVHADGLDAEAVRTGILRDRFAEHGLGCLEVALLDPREENGEEGWRNRTDAELLTSRLAQVVDRAGGPPGAGALPLGIVGLGMGAGAASLSLAARRGDRISAVATHAGHPGLVPEDVDEIAVPTLLVVGERDRELHRINADTERRIGRRARLVTIPGATRRLREAGALREAAHRTGQWIAHWLTADRRWIDVTAPSVPDRAPSRRRRRREPTPRRRTD